MKEWKVRQHAFHRMSPPTDAIQHKQFTVTYPGGAELVDEIVEYFTSQSGPMLHYPSKSYAVAIVYAHLVAKYFNEDVIQCLSDPDLLFGNDIHFVPYTQDPNTYNHTLTVLRDLGLCNFESSPFSQVQTTVKCFKEEFLLS